MEKPNIDFLTMILLDLRHLLLPSSVPQLLNINNLEETDNSADGMRLNELKQAMFLEIQHLGFSHSRTHIHD